jgi:hypothetical protein
MAGVLHFFEQVLIRLVGLCGELDGERFWFEFAEFSGFWSAMANVPKSLLMV